MSDLYQTENSQKVLFSVVVPVYNNERTLRDCLASIEQQSCADYEIIFVDGGSTDLTQNIIKDYQISHRHTRLTLLAGPDNGIYDAMNKGLSISKGQWLYFMGADDRFYSSDVLNVVAGEISKGPVDLIYGNVEGMTSKIRYIYDTTAKVLAVGIHHQSIFYSASLFKNLGNYDLRYKISSDYHFTLKVFLNNLFITRYIDRDICIYGEGGYSSQYFDYKLLSGHYRLISLGDRLTELPNAKKCLDDSIYCCLYLAGKKESLGTAWANLLWYMIKVKQLSMLYRIKTFLRMLLWTFRP